MLLFTLATAICLLQTARADDNETDCSWDEFDQVTTQLVFFAHGANAAQTRDQLDHHCENVPDLTSFADQFINRCATGLRQIMLSMFLDVITTENNEQCNDDQAKEDYLTYAPCLVNDAGSDLLKCNNEQSAFIEALLAVERDNRLPYACCNEHTFEECVIKAAQSCGDDHAEYARKRMDRITAELKETACRQYVEKPELCTELPVVTPVEETKYRTMILALADLLNSL